MSEFRARLLAVAEQNVMVELGQLNVRLGFDEWSGFRRRLEDILTTLYDEANRHTRISGER